MTRGILFEHLGTLYSLLYVIDDGSFWNNTENKLEDTYCEHIFNKILLAFLSKS